MSLNEPKRGPHPTVECCDNCEQENDNLRAILRWCIEVLPREHAAELARRLAGPIEDGGVVEDRREELEREAFDMGVLFGKLADHMQLAVDRQPSGNKWAATAVGLISQARELEEPRQKPTLTLRELREMKLFR